MKNLKLITALLIGMMGMQKTNAQDSVKILKPVYWSADITLGAKNQGTYGGAMLRFYREENFVSLGIRGFDYIPEDLPSDYYAGLDIWHSNGNLNSNTLFLVGYGKFIPTAHETFRVLLQADAALGKYTEAVNFKRREYENGFVGFLTAAFASNYKYDLAEGFTGGVHLLAKAELCSRFASLGINLETFVTTKTTAFCAGVSLGFGKLRKRNN